MVQSSSICIQMVERSVLNKKALNDWLGYFENIRDFCRALRSMNLIKLENKYIIYNMDSVIVETFTSALSILPITWLLQDF